MQPKIYDHSLKKELKVAIPRGKFEGLFLAGIFSIVLAVCSGLTCLNCLTGTSDVISENRLPVSLPDSHVFIDRPPIFFREIENFISDRFSFRHILVASRNWLLYALFQTSGNNEVLLGKDNFMFLSNSAAFHAQTHEQPFSPKELARAVENFKAKSQWLQSHGISYVLMVIPEKGTVYPEKLPDAVNVLPSESRLDALKREVTQKGICTFFDVKEVLLKAKNLDHYLFRRYDSHWNDDGAGLVIQKLCDSLNLSTKPLRKGTASQPDGDLAKMIALGDCFHESAPSFEYERGTARNLIFSRKSPIDESLKFAKFENRTSANNVKIFVIGDSFTNLLIKFFSELTSESSFQFFRDFGATDLLNSGANIVIEEMVERHLYDLEFERCPESVNLLRETTNKYATIGDGIGKPTFANFNDKFEIVDFVATQNRSGITVKVLWRAKMPVKLDGKIHLSVWDKSRKRSLIDAIHNQDFLQRRIKTGDCWLDTFELGTREEAINKDMSLSIAVVDDNKKFIFVCAKEIGWSGGGVYLPLSQSNSSDQFESLFSHKKICYAQE